MKASNQCNIRKYTCNLLTKSIQFKSNGYITEHYKELIGVASYSNAIKATHTKVTDTYGLVTYGGHV